MRINCPPHTRLQDHLLSQGIHILTACGGRGNCGKCVVKVIRGNAAINTMDRIPMWISIIATILIRLPLAWLLAFLTRSEAWPRGNPQALFASLLISWVLAMVMTVIAHRKGAWRRRLPQQL